MPRELLITFYSIAIVILLFLSFFFSSADMAYSAVSISRLEEEKQTKSTKRAIKLAKNYDNTIANILFGNDIVNACLDSVATLFGVNLCFLVLEDGTLASQVSSTWGLVASLIVLFFKITFGEIVPKSIAKVNAYSLSKAYSSIVNVLTYVFYPFTILFSLMGNGISTLFKKNVDDVEIAEDDLHEMIDDIEEKGNVDEDKASMLHDTIKYTHMQANEVMTPRVDIFAIDIDDDIQEIIKQGKLFKHSRIPVYKDTIDNIIGFVHIKSLMVKYLKGERIDLNELLLEPLRVPQSAEINDILRTFKKRKIHFAVVMDEYGGVDGIITMEDILEEIVGEIWDESDRRQVPIVDRRDGSYIIDGNVTLEEFCDLFDIDYDEINTDYMTIGGFIIELLDDKFAKIGDEVVFEGVKIKVIAVDDNDIVEKITAKKIEED